MQFRIKAAVQPKAGALIRAGYSANGRIVLARRDNVLTLKEGVIQYEKDHAAPKEAPQKPFVEVEVAPQQFEKRLIEVGLSDGINIEILSGLTLKDKVKEL